LLIWQLSSIPPARAEIGEEARYQELRRLADELRVNLERNQGEGITLILPPDFPQLPNYVESRSQNGRRLITPSGDSLYLDCMMNVRLNLGLDAVGGGGLLPGLTAYARSQLSAQQCVTDYRERLYSALSGAAVDVDIGRVRVGLGRVDKTLSDV